MNTIPIKPPKWVLKRLENLSYNSKTGKLIWITPTARNLKPGDIAGAINGDGYYHVKFRHKIFGAKIVLVHHIIWYICSGIWPKSELDHKNGNKIDNRIKNLRLATRNNNMHNREKQIRNSSGYKGVIATKNGRPWQAVIRYKNELIYLGRFYTRKRAAKAYDKAALELHGKFARLNFPNG